MNLKPNIRKNYTRKTLWILFILFVSISFSAGGVMANNCQGGTDCMICGAAAHPHFPGVDADMGNHGCQPDLQNRSCGLDAGRSVEQFDSIASIVESNTYQYSGIFIVASEKFDQALMHGTSISQFQTPDPGGSHPIFLLNKSLLC